MRSATSSGLVVRLLGTSSYLAALFVAFLWVGEWAQSLLVTVSVAAGLASARWRSVSLAVLVVPVAVLTSEDEYGGDSVAGPLDVALVAAAFFAAPAAISIAAGVGLRRFAGRRRIRRTVEEGA